MSSAVVSSSSPAVNVSVSAPSSSPSPPPPFGDAGFGTLHAVAMATSTKSGVGARDIVGPFAGCLQGVGSKGRALESPRLATAPVPPGTAADTTPFGSLAFRLGPGCPHHGLYPRAQGDVA